MELRSAKIGNGSKSRPRYAPPPRTAVLAYESPPTKALFRHRQRYRSRSAAAEFWSLSSTADDMSIAECRHILDQQARDGRCLYTPNMRRPRLRELVRRVQRGLLCYDTCSINELRTFCSQRGLQSKDSPKKSDLVYTLEQADENSTFNKFMDLHPELRVCIYESFIHSHDQKTKPGTPHGLNYVLATQPPISRVSRTLRREVLPIFYDSVSFGVYANDYYERREVEGLSKRFIDSLTSESLAMISRLQFEVRYVRSQRWRAFTWDINLGKGRRTPVKTLYRSSEKAVITDRVSTSLQRWLDRMIFRPEGKTFLKTDIQAIFYVTDGRRYRSRKYK